MKLDVKAMAITLGLIWGLVMLIVGLANVVSPGYARAFLEVMASIYPGYTATASVGQVLIGTVYGVVDAAIGGVIFAWIYNQFAKS